MPHTLLLADDSVTIQRVIELTFADEDIQVLAVSDGQQAVERIEADPPDIILADVGMPKRNGYEVATYVKSRPKFAHIPVVLLTGAFEPIDQARATAAGCDGVLAKPFEPQLVISRVKELLSGKRESAIPRRTDIIKPAPSTAVKEPAAEVPIDGSRPTGKAGDSNVLLDNYFDELDAAFAKIGTASEANARIEPPPPAASPNADFGWLEAGSLRKSNSRLVPRVVDMPASSMPTRPSSRNAATSTSSGPSPLLAKGEITREGPPDDLDFAGVTGIDADEPRAARGGEESMPQSFTSFGAGRTSEQQNTGTGRNPTAPAAPIADRFAALLAAEQGERPAPPPVTQPSAEPAPTTISAGLVDEIAAKVLDKLSDNVVRETVAQIVSRIAERVVREEIERIKQGGEEKRS